MRHAAHSPKACVASTTVVGGLRKSHRAWREEALETARVGAAAMGGTDEGAQAKKMEKKNKQTRVESDWSDRLPSLSSRWFLGVVAVQCIKQSDGGRRIIVASALSRSLLSLSSCGCHKTGGRVACANRAFGGSEDRSGVAAFLIACGGAKGGAGEGGKRGKTKRHA